MSVNIIFRIAAVGILVTILVQVCCHILAKDSSLCVSNCFATFFRNGWYSFSVFVDIFKTASGSGVKQLETHSEESFAKIWQQTADQKLKQVIYEPKFYEILKNMGETIGYLDQQMQEKTILLTIEQLDDQIFLMKDQVVKNCKMYRSLGISLSVLIVIILL